MKNREYCGEAGVKNLESRLQEFLESEGAGFVVIYTSDPYKVTDVYRNMCGDCVLDVMEKTLIDAEAKGLLSESEAEPETGHEEPDDFSGATPGDR